MNDPDYEERLRAARRRVKQLRGFYTHLAIFVIINLFLFALDLADGGIEWAFWPLLGWGIGLAIHAFSTFGLGGMFGSEWEERKIQELMGEKPKRRE